MLTYRTLRQTEGNTFDSNFYIFFHRSRNETASGIQTKKKIIIRSNSHLVFLSAKFRTQSKISPIFSTRFNYEKDEIIRQRKKLRLKIPFARLIQHWNLSLYSSDCLFHVLIFFCSAPRWKKNFHFIFYVDRRLFSSTLSAKNRSLLISTKFDWQKSSSSKSVWVISSSVCRWFFSALTTFYHGYG